MSTSLPTTPRMAAIALVAGAALVTLACSSGPPSRVDPPPSVSTRAWGPQPPPPQQAFSEVIGELGAATCTDALAELRDAQRRASAISAPFTTWANRALAHTYNGILNRYWPAWMKHYQAFAVHRGRGEFRNERIWRANQCGHASHNYLAELADCYRTEQPCSASPRLIAQDLLGVAFAEPVVVVPDHCRTSDVGPYPVEGVQATAQQAGRAVVPYFDAAWVDWLAREAALLRLEQQLDRMCANAGDPRAPEWGPETRRELILALTGLETPLAAEDSGTWTLSNGQIRVPPSGTLRRVLTFEPGPGSPAERTSSAAAKLPLLRRATTP